MEKIRKKKWLWICVAVSGIALLCFFWMLKGQSVSAAWVEQSVDQQAAYSQFPLEHYALDISGDAGLLSEIGMNLVNLLANAVFSISNLLSYFCGWVMEEAYAVDFIGSAIDSIAQNIQAIAGVDEGGFREHGLLPSLAPLLILLAGAYFVWVGIFRRKTAQAAVNLAAFSMVFVLGMGAVAYAGGYMSMINNFQQEFNAEIMEISSLVTLGESEEGGTDMVGQMRDNLFQIMIKNPYLMFQYGTSDVDAVGEERINELLGLEPGSDERQELADREVEDLENSYMGAGHLAERFGMCLVVLLVNLVIGGSVLLFAAMLIIAQVLFVLYMSFFPVALVFSMFPNSGSRLSKILGQCLDTILMRPAVSLILTVVFSISTLCYQLIGTSNYLWAMFLQGAIFVIALVKTGEFLGYMRIGNRQQGEKSIMRYLIGGMGARAVYKGSKALVKNTYRGARQGGHMLWQGARGAAEYGEARANRSYYLKDVAMKENVPQTARQKSGTGTRPKTSPDGSVIYASSLHGNTSSPGTSDVSGTEWKPKNAGKRMPGQSGGHHFEKNRMLQPELRLNAGKAEGRTGERTTERTSGMNAVQSVEQISGNAVKRIPGQRNDRAMDQNRNRQPGQKAVSGKNAESAVERSSVRAAERNPVEKQPENTLKRTPGQSGNPMEQNRSRQTQQRTVPGKGAERQPESTQKRMPGQSGNLMEQNRGQQPPQRIVPGKGMERTAGIGGVQNTERNPAESMPKRTPGQSGHPEWERDRQPGAGAALERPDRHERSTGMESGRKTDVVKQAEKRSPGASMSYDTGNMYQKREFQRENRMEQQKQNAGNRKTEAKRSVNIKHENRKGTQ